VSSYIDITHDDIKIPTKTVAFWVKRGIFTQRYSKLLGAAGGKANNYQIFFRNTDTLYIRWVNSSGSTKTKIVKNLGFNEGKWTFFVAVWDVNESRVKITLYKNSSLILSYQDEEGYYNNYASSFWIGKDATGNYFNGSVDDFMIFSRALSPDEVKALFNNQK